MTKLFAAFLLFLPAGPDGRTSAPRSENADHLQNSRQKPGFSEKPGFFPSGGVENDLSHLRELLYTRQAPQEQSQTALALVQSNDPEAADLVRQGLRRHDRPDVFQALAAAMRLRRDARYLDLLLAALAAEQPAVRRAAEETLAGLDSPTLVRRLADLAENSDTPPPVRFAATAALGRSVQKGAVVALLNLLGSNTAPVRQSAASALEELTGCAYGTNAGQWHAWWERYKDASDAEWLATRTAYFADRARRLQGDLQQAETQILQLQRLLYAKTPAADRANYLRTLIQSEYPPVREQAVAWIVAMLAEPAANKKPLVEMLLALSNDGVPQVQRQAVLALEKADDPRVFDRLLTLLQCDHVTVRAAAARSLGRYRGGRNAESASVNSRAVVALERALADPSLIVAAEAAESLGALGAPEAVPVLAGLLRHPTDSVRQAAARALEPLSGTSILSELYAGLNDPLPDIRFSIVGALGKVAAAGQLTEAQRTELLKLLETVLVRDGDPGVRSRVAAVLGDIGTPAEIPVLWQRVKATEDNRVQLKAWTAMIDILSRSASWALVSEWDQTVASQQPTRRLELLTEVRNRWAKLESAKPHMDQLTAALLQAQLADRKWNLAFPVARDWAKKAADDTELRKRLRWLLNAGKQALEEKKPQEVLEILNGLGELQARAGELSTEFDALRQRATEMRDTVKE